VTDRMDLEELLQIVEAVDAHLDAEISPPYREQPLARTWARVTKVCSEAGEVMDALSAWTGENPRKGVHGTEGELHDEMGDTAMAAIFGIQHLTKDTERTLAVLARAARKAQRRVDDYQAEEVSHGS
jgi:NTP pyrophosphatase (non-canonical NTP hydrolase)